LLPLIKPPLIVLIILLVRVSVVPFRVSSVCPYAAALTTDLWIRVGPYDVFLGYCF